MKLEIATLPQLLRKHAHADVPIIGVIGDHKVEGEGKHCFSVAQRQGFVFCHGAGLELASGCKFAAMLAALTDCNLLA